MTATMKSEVAWSSPPAHPAVDRAGERILAGRVLPLRVRDRVGQVGLEQLHDPRSRLRPGDGHVDRVGVLLAVEPPALRAQEVHQVVDLEGVGGEGEAERRRSAGAVAHDPQLRVGADDVHHRGGGLEDLPRVLAVALPAQRHHRRPGARDQATRARTLHAGRHVLAAAPVEEVEVLRLAQRLVAEQQRRAALERVAVLVGVGRDRGDAGDPEVEHGDVVPELLAERQDEPAEAAVHVHAHPARRRELRQLGDRVDRAVGVVARRAHDRDRLVVDQLGHRVDVGQRGLRVDRRDAQLDPEQVTALVEGRVAGLGLHEVGPGDAPGLAGVLAVGDERVQDRAGPARGHQAGRLAVGHRLGVHQVEGHRDDLALELGLARAHVALEGVDVGEHAERLAEEVVVLVVAAVHRPGDLAGLPERVLLGGHRLHLGQHVGARPPARGERPVDGVPVGVREVVHGPDATAHGRAPD